MGKTFKIQKAHRVFSGIKSAEDGYSSIFSDNEAMLDWQTCGRRHGNNRGVYPALKKAKKKVRRRHEADDTQAAIVDSCNCPAILFFEKVM